MQISFGVMAVTVPGGDLVDEGLAVRDAIRLSVACLRGAIMGIVFAVGMNYLGTTYASAQSAPDYAALVAAPDRSDGDRVADKRRVIRCRSLRSPR